MATWKYSNKNRESLQRLPVTRASNNFFLIQKLSFGVRQSNISMAIKSCLSPPWLVRRWRCFNAWSTILQQIRLMSIPRIARNTNTWIFTGLATRLWRNTKRRWEKRKFSFPSLVWSGNPLVAKKRFVFICFVFYVFVLRNIWLMSTRSLFSKEKNCWRTRVIGNRSK